MGAPALLLCGLLLRHNDVNNSTLCVMMVLVLLGWIFAVSLLIEQIIRPLQTLTNVVGALREDDYSFRARGGRRNDVLGDLALEINALAGMLQAQRSSSIEAMALVERVVRSMQSPVLAFDPERRLRLLNAAGERAFLLKTESALNRQATELALDYLLDTPDDGILSFKHATQPTRWMVKRTNFRLRGVPHQLFVLADVSAALKEEERIAWERLIRVMGHEINNSLTPIKSIAGSLQSRLALLPGDTNRDDFERGLNVISDRADSLNRFLQAYRRLDGMPPPQLQELSLCDLIDQVAQIETRVSVKVIRGPDLTVMADPDQLQQALINLLKNAAEAALSADMESSASPTVEIEWKLVMKDVIVVIRDNGPGLMSDANLFVPFYTTKPRGSGIGLVLAQQIAEGHRGAVRLRNRSGSSGCEAEFIIPSSN
jgi:nitrogen fixation/metabolism regulation signal transduction histidine kinase